MSAHESERSASWPATTTALRPHEAPKPRLVGFRVKVLGVLAPLAFLACLGLIDRWLEATDWWLAPPLNPTRLLIGLAVVACIVCFALWMFRLIDAAERALVHHNRDLTAANRVASAIQGQPDVAGILDAATATLVQTSGASRVRLLLNPIEAAEGTTAPAAGPSDGDPEARPTLVVPLSNGASTLGRMEFWYPDGTPEGDRLGSSTLSTLGSQVASALQLARAMEYLHRGRDEGHAFYDVLVRISGQTGTLATLHAIAAHARRLLSADAGAIVINTSTANSVRFDSDADAPVGCSDGTSVLGVGLPDHIDEPTGTRVNPIGCHHWNAEAERPIPGAAGSLGWLWVGRFGGVPFSDRDTAFLATLAELAGIALAGAEHRESSRRAAVLSERTRIARETHDSHAQALAAVHLRLRTLELAADVRTRPGLAREVAALAEVCDEAYQDVRDVILALRDSDAPGRGLAETLRAYLDKYSHHYGIRTHFVNKVGDGLALSPRSEAEVIRVIQEALTNVRKHAHATSATLTVTGSATSTLFTVADDGTGFTAVPHSAGGVDGYGLCTMRERLSLLGGTLEISSAPHQGTRVMATVPEGPVRAVLTRSTAR